MFLIDRAAIQKAKLDRAFGANAWLTFYLDGKPEDHLAMQPLLAQLGGFNLGGYEGGFVYAKLPVGLNYPEISDLIVKVRALADSARIAVAIIDLDSSPDVERSQFYTVWQAT